jgi:uncharacterized hydrophobic protein (TIGR00271 family)
LEVVVPSVASSDIVRMRDQVFFEGPQISRRLSRFWMLLVLAAVIATAGVIGDSTATVIGAMIVAPLMTPILGIVVAIVLGQRANLARSVAMVVGGAAVVVAVAWLMGTVISLPVNEATNSQVAIRVHPRLIDLVAALATGAVGAFALARSDISDTLPGVAIAISLVPPLAVVGLTLEAGEPGQATGALLLFATNVAAILATGVVVMAIYGVHRHVVASDGFRRRNAIGVVVAFVAVVVVPLAASTAVIATDAQDVYRITGVAEQWAEAGRWSVVSVDRSDDAIVVRAIGAGEPPDPAQLRRDLDDAGYDGRSLDLHLIPETRIELGD